MPIFETDHRLMLAEDMSQEETGGGRMSNVEAPNGQVSTLFRKLARLDFLGAWRAAKFFQWISTPGQEEGARAHIMLTRTPIEPLVDVLLVQTGSHTDRLPDIRAYCGNYLVPGGPAPCYLYSAVTVAQDQVQLWQRLDQVRPTVGDVFQIENDDGEVEYLKLASVADQTLTLYDSAGDAYQRRLLTCKLAAPLQKLYDAVPIGKADPAAPVTELRGMFPNSALRFRGVANLSENIAGGSSTFACTVDSIYRRLVPASYIPAALTNRRAVPVGQQTFRSGGIDFPVSGPVHTVAVHIGTGNQDSLYVVPLSPAPAAGTCTAKVRILGTTITAYEDAALNPPGITLSVANETATLSLGEAGFPDLDSIVVFAFGSGLHFTDRAGTTQVSPISIPFALAQRPEAGTVALSWTSGGNAKSATVSTGGVISGHCSGFLVGQEGVAQFTANLPDSGTTLAVTYQPLSTVSESVTPTLTGNIGAFALAEQARPGSIRVRVNVQRQIAGYHAVASAAQVPSGSTTAKLSA